MNRFGFFGRVGIGLWLVHLIRQTGIMARFSAAAPRIGDGTVDLGKSIELQLITFSSASVRRTMFPRPMFAGGNAKLTPPPAPAAICPCAFFVRRPAGAGFN